MALSSLFASTPLALFFCFLPFLAAVLYGLSWTGYRAKDLPPGPPTLPILGNLLQALDPKRHITFQKWAEQYGCVFM